MTHAVYALLQSRTGRTPPDQRELPAALAMALHLTQIGCFDEDCLQRTVRSDFECLAEQRRELVERVVRRAGLAHRGARLQRPCLFARMSALRSCVERGD